ncbi:MAG: molybdopterin molybdotransferase MoeA [Pyrinomonadaceae bacterium]|nr:molybdopterin molybdotransferase MoeA [Pyrinomonadaceae bacterium]MCX7640072.1 molybdopterin molybdotransferase MoeA [Pyrinomonadaceae bacterium]MDW8304244.1 molybdopterin molybdotransferase MoeA [Acidobacteriota bacterium]
MIPIHEAFKIIDDKVYGLSTEQIRLEDSVGRVLAEDIFADMDLPPFCRSQMDGFAVRSEDTRNAPVRLRVIGESIAGKGFDGEVRSKEAVRIMTGARVPLGADSVQKQELTRLHDGFVEVLQSTEPNQNIVQKGEEIKKGTKVFSSGQQITERMIPTLASFGYAQLKVYRQPEVLIMSTGTELVEISQKPGKDEIRNSNSVMLAVFLQKYGVKARVLPNISDDEETLIEVIREKILNSQGRVLVTTGGVSVGDYDFTKSAFCKLGAEIFFDKVSLKPGKPTVFAKLGESFIFGLPGNPVSSAVTFYLFVRRAILRMQRALEVDLKSGYAIVAKKIKSTKERDSVLPVVADTDERGRLIVKLLKFAGSSNFIEFAGANALVYVPRGKDLEEGEIARVWFFD